MKEGGGGVGWWRGTLSTAQCKEEEEGIKMGKLPPGLHRGRLEGALSAFVLKVIIRTWGADCPYLIFKRCTFSNNNYIIHHLLQLFSLLILSLVSLTFTYNLLSYSNAT